MQKLVTSSQMREIDRRTVEEFKIPSIILMERAGQAVFKFIKNKFISPDNKLFFIFCGRGNNGGDGLVVARLLYKSNAQVYVFLCGKIEKLRGDTKRNLDLLLPTAVKIVEVPTEKEMHLIFNSPPPDLIIDAILGTGLAGDVSGVTKQVIEYINSSKVPVVSVDIPSGLDADSGKILGSCVKATYTVTMGLTKTGLCVYPGADYTGEVTVADIGFPAQLLEGEDIKSNLVTRDYVKKCLGERDPNTHKGDYGKILILAGSVGYTGAAYLCAQGCIRAGAGLVTLGIPYSLNQVMEIKLTEVITLPLPETEERTFGIKSIPPVLDFLQNCNALAIGPGISTSRQIFLFVKELIKKINLPVVIDADALNVLAKDTSVFQKIKAPLILTPHPGELSRLIKISIREVQESRCEVASYAARELNCILVLKGARTVIADKEGNIFINPTGNPGMATAGVGDILTGIISAFIGQGMPPLSAAICGVYVHGRAGDIAREKVGETSLIAQDILEHLSFAFKEIER